MSDTASAAPNGTSKTKLPSLPSNNSIPQKGGNVNPDAQNSSAEELDAPYKSKVTKHQKEIEETKRLLSAKCEKIYLTNTIRPLTIKEDGLM